MININDLFNEFINKYNLNTKLSFDMPKGYDDAYGTYDVTKDTLFFNLDMINLNKEYEAVFYLNHELRHAYQYNFSDKFNEDIRVSLPYVILYNGQCFKLVNNNWLSCKLEGDEEYFTNIYLSLPYELDANNYAKDKTINMYPNLEKEINNLYSKFVPSKLMNKQDLKQVFNKINNII